MGILNLDSQTQSGCFKLPTATTSTAVAKLVELSHSLGLGSMPI